MSDTPRVEALMGKDSGELLVLARQLERELAEYKRMLDDPSYGEVCQDGIACKKPGECKARNKCAVFGEIPPLDQPVAWLHKEHGDAYVISARVKEIWEQVNPKHVENYTVPLYPVRRLQAAFVSPSYEAALLDPRQSQPRCLSCGGWVKVEEGGICMPCHTEGRA